MMATSSRALPEPWIWHVVKGIAECLVYFENGALQKDKVPGWETIVHRDMKAENGMSLHLDRCVQVQDTDINE